MTHPTDDELEACAFETGLNEALKVIASIGYGKNQDVDEGHEEAYRAVETYLKERIANKPADLCTPTDERVARLIKAASYAAREIQDYIDDDTGIGPLEDARDTLRAALRDVGVE